MLGFERLHVGLAFGQLCGQPLHPFLQLRARERSIRNLLLGFGVSGLLGLQAHLRTLELGAERCDFPLLALDGCGALL